jgi:protein-L-isoaspartate(D-aspartate) O-methyltransferase
MSLIRGFALVLAAVLAAQGCSDDWVGSTGRGATDSTGDYAKLRKRMIDEQLRDRGISDARVLAAMAKVPRHEFVPAELRDQAYQDSALPLILGQTISQPYVVAYMTQALQLTGVERVLEVGSGSGYQAAVLAEIVREVYTIEILPELAATAKTLLERLGYENVHFRTGDGYLGWPEFAPYDRIIVTAAPDHVPQPLIEQLKSGGRMIIPVGTVDQELKLIEKGPSGVVSRSTIPVRFVPLTRN